ncbi:hypothetical protein [Actinomadura sp. KC345]|nr:hypothetical protein [Actinomadura sp. KC345]
MATTVAAGSPAASSPAAVRARSICRMAPRVSPVAARNRRSTVRPETSGR